MDLNDIKQALKPPRRGLYFGFMTNTPYNKVYASIGMIEQKNI